MALISAQYANLMDANINKAFSDYFKLHPEEYKEWCDVQKSSKQYEQDAMFGEMKMPGVLGEYENAPESDFAQGPKRTWTHVKYGFKVTASEELIEDERFPVVVKAAGKMGIAMKHRLNVAGAYDLNNSFTVSTVGSADTASETLCATSHASFGDGAAQANRPTTDVTLGVDSFWAGVTNFHGLKDREDNPIMKIPKKLIIPAALERRAIEMLESKDVPYLATNELNAIRKYGMSYVIGHYLTASAAWWITTDEKAIRFYMRRPVTIKAENTITNDSRSWVITTRFSHGPMDWYDIYGTDGVA